MSEQSKPSPFQTLGGNSTAGVCGPDGCSIEKHRQEKKKGSTSND